MGLVEVPIAPRSPWQNAYVERFVGSLRRECLDHVTALNERHVCRIVSAYAHNYNHVRTHLALEKDAPEDDGCMGESVALSLHSRRWAGSIIDTSGRRLES